MQSLGLLLTMLLIGTGILLNTVVLVYFTARMVQAMPGRKGSLPQSRAFAPLHR